MKPKLDIHQSITDSIVAAIEAGAGDCVMPWHRTGLAGLLPKNASSGNAYNGINVVSLWAAAQERGYSHAIWGTYKQWQGLGAQVRGGEKAAPIVFYKQFEVEPNHEDESDDGTRRVARASWVFNVAHIQMPDEWRFRDTDAGLRTEGYFSIACHELTHWTAPKQRCDRQMGKHFADDLYAGEELVAELGSAFLCAELGISPQPARTMRLTSRTS